MNPVTIAIIGGSGLYELDGLTKIKEHQVDTPFGKPSSVIVSGMINNTPLLFLARHGKGHCLTPTEVNYKANIFALKKLGVNKVISVSAVGSMRQNIKPGDVISVSQYIDRTKGRPSTFFGDGIVGHVMFGDPVCPELSTYIYDCAIELGLTAHKNGTLMVMEGPAFSTRAESNMHRQMGVDLIGMTAMPEAKLAREAELCYGTMALATDYDCWHEFEEDVSVEAVMTIMKHNVKNAKKIIVKIVEKIESAATNCSCASSLDFAIVTDKKIISKNQKEKMAPIFGRVL